MSKKITAAALSSASKKVYDLKTFHIEDVNGEIWDVAIDTKMAPLKVNEMAKQTLLFMNKLLNEGFDRDLLINNWNVMWYAFLLEHFTDVVVPKKKKAKDTYKAYVNLLEGLVNLGLLEKIINQFEKESFQRTVKIFTEVVEDIGKSIEGMKESKLKENKQEVADNFDEDTADLVVEDETEEELDD